MTSLEAKKIRVFWHEIGHHIAAIYNQQYFCGHGIDRIEISYNQAINEFSGETFPLKPENYVPQYEAHPVSWIASLSYGCIFQAIQQPNGDFFLCFDWKGHGDTDINKVTGTAERMGMYAEEKRPLFACIQNHYLEISNNREFASLFDQDIGYLIKGDEPKITISPNQVKEIIADFLPKHEQYYLRFVAALDQIFKPYLI